MSFGITGAIGPVAIELGLRFGENLEPSRSGPFAVSVDVGIDLDMDGLGILAANGGRAFVVSIRFLP